MAKYSHIVFIDQAQDFAEWEEIYTTRGVDHAAEYLTQWDYGDDYDVRDESSAGASDHQRVYLNHGQEYLMSFNLGLGYVGLERIITDENGE